MMPIRGRKPGGSLPGGPRAPSRQGRRLPGFLLFGAGLLALPHIASAHSGPPFPILVDQPIPGYVISLWTDPDVGEATFFVVAEPDKAGSRPEIAAVEIWLQPASGRLPKAVLPAVREQGRGHLRFTALPEIDAAELWHVGFEMAMADGSRHAFATEVEATPPGGGPWYLLFYLFPFILFGGLWAMVFVRRSRLAAAARADSAQVHAPSAGAAGGRP